jgi:hypothetical protein
MRDLPYELKFLSLWKVVYLDERVRHSGDLDSAVESVESLVTTFPRVKGVHRRLGSDLRFKSSHTFGRKAHKKVDCGRPNYDVGWRPVTKAMLS